MTTRDLASSPATPPQLVDEDTHLVFTYIDALVSGGHEPSAEEVEAYASAPRRRTERHLIVGDYFQALFSNLAFGGQVQREPAEKWVAYLGRLRWVDVRDSRIRLSRAGAALLKYLNIRLAGLEDEIPLVVTPDDPLAYPKVIAQIATLENVMVVDPYVEASDLLLLAGEARVQRVLVSRKTGKKRLAALQAVHSRLAAEAAPEIRIAETLHDRFVVGDGRLLTIGSSLNGVGRNLTVVTPLTGDAAAALRRYLEDEWQGAKPLQGLEEKSSPRKSRTRRKDSDVTGVSDT